MNTLTRGVRKQVLDNGLTVLSKEIHTAPVVSVQVWYRVGSRNEAPGSNGISHQLEHLLFKGTKDRPIQFGRLFSALGSASNAFTSYDMTAYYGTVGRDKLEALLLLEADRMRHALIDPEPLESEKRVVISELQGYDNSPEYRLSQAVMRQAFPERAYGLPVGGTKTDVERFTVQQVRDYYQHYYRPDNAVLVVAGDFDPEQLQALVQQTFGAIPASPASADGQDAVSASQGLQADPTPIYLREPGSAALIEAVYPIPAVKHPDGPILDVMDTILSVGRHSRFYQSLIEPGLASQVHSYSASLIEPGWYDISLTLVPDQSLATVDQILLQTLQTLQDEPVTPAELQRAKQQLMAHFIMSNRDIDNQASQLAYNQTIAGDHCYSDRYLDAIQSVTVADVQRVAQTYLAKERRTVGYFEPTRLEDNAEMGGVSRQHTAEDFSPSEPVDPAIVAQYLPPLHPTPVSASQLLPETMTLDNGLTILLLADSSSPTVSICGYIQAGNGLDALDKAGMASLTAETLMGGTQSRNALDLAKVLEDRGAELDFSAFREGVEIDGHALAPDLELLLQTLADVLQRASFPETELELSRTQALSSLQMELDDPQRLGRRVLQQRLYAQDHPYHGFATLESLQAIAQTDVLHFYRQHYTPDRTILVLVGDFDVGQVRRHVQTYFGNWQSSEKSHSLLVPDVAVPQSIQRVPVPLPGKHQAVTYMGYPGIARRDPRFYPALVLNQILGGDTLASRLGTEIRDRQGLTYGIYSYFAAGQLAGPFVIEMQTAPEDTEKAIQSTLALLRQFRQEGVSESELASAKRSLINSYPVELANLDTLAHRVLMNAVDGFDVTEIRDFPTHIDRITLSDIDQAIQDLIQPEQLLIVTAGPA